MRTIVLVSCVSLVSGLAGDGAWKTKPAIPELQQSSPTEPSSERQKWEVKNSFNRSKTHQRPATTSWWQR